MTTQRILFTGHGLPQLQRHVNYALQLGATVLHVGYNTLYPTNTPAGYTFAAIAQDSTPAMRARTERGEAYQALVSRESQRLAALAADFCPDVCHAYGLDLTFELCVLAKLRPLVVSASGFLNHWVYEKADLIERDHALKQINLLLVQSPLMVEIARTLLPATVRVEKFIIGTDCTHFRPLDATTRANTRRALDVSPESFAILSPRGWAPGYNQELVLSAFAQALPHLPSLTTLLFVALGRSGERDKSYRYFEETQQLATTLGIADHVRWLPAFPNLAMPTLYNAADLIISYLSNDAFSMTILEALACARPMIVSDLPTYRDSVISEHCRLAPPQNSDALAETMIDMVHNPPVAERLEAGRRAILQRYDKTVVLQQLATLYDEIASIKLTGLPETDL